MPMLRGTMRALLSSGAQFASAGAGAFDPLTLSPVLWLKADAGTFQTSGGAAATADGDPVGEWQDQSGNANHMGQATAGLRPSLKLAIQNGLPVVRFDGIDDYIAAAFALTQPEDVFAVFRPSSYGGTKRVWDGNAGNSMGLYQSGAAPELSLYAGNGLAFSGPATSSFGLVQATYNGASSAARLNGGAATTGDAGAANAAGLKLATNGGVSLWLDVDFAEMLIFGAVLSAGDRANVETYLNGRWGVF